MEKRTLLENVVDLSRNAEALYEVLKKGREITISSCENQEQEILAERMNEKFKQAIDETLINEMLLIISKYTYDKK